MLSSIEIDKVTLVNTFQKHLDLNERSQSSFKMLDSFVSHLPTGNESGIYYAIDFGGTNFRVARVVISDGDVQLTQNKHSLADVGKYRQGMLDAAMPATEMFEHLADLVIESIAKFNDSDKQINIGFTFSFPSSQTAINRAKLVNWTKQFETGRQTNDPVEGIDVGLKLQEALDKKNVNAKVVAVVNDTVGTLVTGAYESDYPETVSIGLILGTGSNGCYIEPKAQDFGYVGKIINIEFGNLPMEPYGLRASIDTSLDEWLASSSGTHIQQQQFERMVSGKYLGELSRLLYLHECKLSKQTPDKKYEEAWGLSSAEACALFAKYTSRSSNEEKSEASLIESCAASVVGRSADMAACSIVAIGKHTEIFSEKPLEEELVLTVAIDGSLFTENKEYEKRMMSSIMSLVGKNAETAVKLVAARDGSGVGAAIIAALTCSSS